MKVSIYEDNKNLRDSLFQLLAGVEGISVLGTYSNCSNILSHIKHNQPEIILMDIEMPEVDGLQGLKIVKEYAPNIKVIMVTVFEDDERIFESIKMGADGYLLKRTSPVKLIESIFDVFNGGVALTPSIAKKVFELFRNPPKSEKISQFGLTPKEDEVLKLLVLGYSYKMIGSHMNLTVNTVSTHIKNIYLKMQVNSAPEAVAKHYRTKVD